MKSKPGCGMNSETTTAVVQNTLLVNIKSKIPTATGALLLAKYEAK